MTRREQVLAQLAKSPIDDLTEIPIRPGVVFQPRGIHAAYVAIEARGPGWDCYKISRESWWAGPYDLIVADTPEEIDRGALVIHCHLPLYVHTEDTRPGWNRITDTEIAHAQAVAAAWRAGEAPQIAGQTGQSLIGERARFHAAQLADHELARRRLHESPVGWLDTLIEGSKLWKPTPDPAVGLTGDTQSREQIHAALRDPKNRQVVFSHQAGALSLTLIPDQPAHLFWLGDPAPKITLFDPAQAALDELQWTRSDSADAWVATIRWEPGGRLQLIIDDFYVVVGLPEPT